MAYNGEPVPVFPERVFEHEEYRGKSGDFKKRSMKLTKRQRAILAGALLGDAYLQKTGERNARLRLEHGGKQKEYLAWKTAQFPRQFFRPMTRIARVHPGTKQTYVYYRAQSHATPILGAWHSRFYPNGKKQIPGDLAEILEDSVMLAVWYMDDGYYDPTQKHSFIYLGRVTRAKAEIAQHAIESRFRVSSKLYDKKQKGYALFFSVAETKKLHALIGRDVPASMRYKLSLTP